MDRDDKLLIKDLTLKTRKGYLCVRVMRKWPFDGNIPGGPVLYIALVLADEEGKAIYAQIPQSEVHRLGPELELEKVYTLRKFSVKVSKTTYVPFDAELMIQITSFTTVTPSRVSTDLFPKIIYNITAFSDIITVGEAANKYIDVIGIITSEKLPKTTCPKGKDYILTLKEVTIKDLSGEEIIVTLWENHVDQFRIQAASPGEQPHSVVGLFCGCLPKKIFNKTHVNAGRACRWFLNPDIKEAEPFYASLESHPVPIYQEVADQANPQPQVQPRVLQHKTVAEMDKMDPYDFPEEGCKCTVAVTQIPPQQEWWYMGCELCKKRVRNEGGRYYCSPCKWAKAMPMYKFSFSAADQTAEARFFCYDVIARQIIRRNCDSLLAAVGSAPGIPQQILGVIGRTYTFVVELTAESYHSMDSRIYLVDSCMFHPQQQVPGAPPPLLLQPALAPIAQQAPARLPAPDTGSSHEYEQQLQETTSEIIDIQAESILDGGIPQTPPPPFSSQQTLIKDKSAVKGKSATSQIASDRSGLHNDDVRKRLHTTSESDHGVTETDDLGKSSHTTADKHDALDTDTNQTIGRSAASKNAPSDHTSAKKRSKAH